MPNLYLSPSTQEFNHYVNGLGTEEEQMNRLADAMEPLLFASGIRFTRNPPDRTAAAAIRASNAGDYDLHLALHSNASGPGQEGQNRGILAFYFPGSSRGLRAAELLANGLKTIYPLPNLVRPEPRRCCWSWGSTTTPTTPSGSSPTFPPWPRTWPCP